MAGITQNGQKRFISIVVPQSRIADYTGFKKRIVKNFEDSNKAKPS